MFHINFLLKHFWLIGFIFLSFILCDSSLNATTTKEKLNFLKESLAAKERPAQRAKVVIDAEQDQIDLQKAIQEELEQKNGVKKLDHRNAELYELALSTAPKRLQVLIEDMAKGKEYTKRYRVIVLVGPSGSGKTLLGEAIIYKLNKKCLVVNGPDFLAHFRDQAAEKVREVFKIIREFIQKPILFINEINALTDDHTSEHSDTNHTAMQLWTSLDDLQHDEDFLLIATTNITNKMPQQLQSRLRKSTFYIDKPSLEARVQTFKFYIRNFNLFVDESVSDIYLQELVQKTENFSHRDIEALLEIAQSSFACDSHDDETKKMTQDHFEKAYKEMMQDENQLWDFSKHMTAEERRHRESMQQNKQQYEDNKELQMKLNDFNALFHALMTTISKDGHTPTIEETIEKLNQARSIIFPEREPKVEIIKTKDWPSRWLPVASSAYVQAKKNTAKG